VQKDALLDLAVRKITAIGDAAAAYVDEKRRYERQYAGRKERQKPKRKGDETVDRHHANYLLF
jgi:hypothetical protein